MIMKKVNNVSYFINVLHEFHVKYPSDFKRAYECSILKFKLKKLKKEPSISNFKSYMELFHNKKLDKKGDEVIICENVNNINKRFKEVKTTELKT